MENTLEVKKVRTAPRQYVISCFLCGMKVYDARDNRNHGQKTKDFWIKSDKGILRGSF